ncbi:MAG: hypothetical protein QGF59_09160 [Pirellulaceae bacterium]|jgi:CheY-like chemotaxis protein|nr:hypothetical protein [Pirellulaceae bacterium]
MQDTVKISEKSELTDCLPTASKVRAFQFTRVSLTAAASLAVLTFDLSLPLGVAGGVPYVLMDITMPVMDGYTAAGLL